MNNDKYQNRYRIPSTRLQNWDYGWNAIYFVTICTKNRRHFFGEITNGKMHLSPVGAIADVLWHELTNHFDNIELDAFVVMPNHIHGIIAINNVGNGNGGIDDGGIGDGNGDNNGGDGDNGGNGGNGDNGDDNGNGGDGGNNGDNGGDGGNNGRDNACVVSTLSDSPSLSGSPSSSSDSQSSSSDSPSSLSGSPSSSSDSPSSSSDSPSSSSGSPSSSSDSPSLSVSPSSLSDSPSSLSDSPSSSSDSPSSSSDSPSSSSDSPSSLSDSPSSCTQQTTQPCKAIGQQRFQHQGSKTLSSIVGSYKSAVSRHAHRLGYDFSWQSRFYDIIIRDYSALIKIQSYIWNNPINWKEDNFLKQ